MGSENSIPGRIKGVIRRRINRYRNKRISVEAERFLVSAEKAAGRIKSMPEGEERHKLSSELKAKEDALKAKSPKVNKVYKRRMKSKYIKEIIPEVYAAEAVNPVEDKVVFMENGTFPSFSARLLYDELKKQGKYNIKTTGLRIREVADVEYYMNAVDFVREMATAKAVFISTANPILSHFDVRPETRIIQLWHGVGMFKKVGFSTVDSKSFGHSAKTREEYNEYRNYTDVTIAGEEQIWTFEDAFRISRDTGVYKAVGIARTDVFFDEDYRQKQLQKLTAAFPECEGKKIILYGPTFRGSVSKAKAPDKLDICKLAERLSDEYVLLIRHHGLCRELPAIPKDLENRFAFDLNSNPVLDIDGLLSIADILITDYSSIGFQFAIREKPIVFFAYDLEDYIDARGMYYDYSEITPGPVCKTTEEIADYIADIDNRFDIQQIRDFREKYVGACDGHATERTIALIEGK